MKQRNPIHVTDHAVLRWLDRTGLIDVNALRAGIEARLARSHLAASTLGVDNYLIVADGLVFVVRDNVVTTVANDEGRFSHARRLEFQPQGQSQQDQPQGADAA